MQAEFIEKWSEICKCASKPLIEMTQLNVNTLNNMVRHANISEFTQAREPKDLLAIQSRLANEAMQSAGNYTQKMTEIWQDATLQSSKIFNDILRETASRASADANIFKEHVSKSNESVRQASKNRE